jgi:serine/threonine-protein kinase
MSQVQTNLSGLEDRFQIHSELGTGGTGSVFEALDLVLMRKVAIKVLHAGFDGSAAARFQREAQATSRLNNPNLVHVLDFGVDTAGKPYLVMEYLEGEDLVNVLKNNGALPTTKVLEIALQLCGALAHAHEKGILHRDLKPSNIIMQRTDEGERVKLVDFGLAKLLDSNQSLTTSGATVGTVSYISPEMANGKAVDERSDLYSLGCVLFECLTGTPPFRGETVHQTLLMHSQSSPPRLSCANVSFPRFVESMVEKLLEKNPDKRYQTAREVRTDIEGYLNSLEENRNQPADTDEEQHPSIIPDYANTLRSGLLGSPESADLPDVSKKRKALSTRKIAISISILLMALIGAIAFGALNLNRQEAGQLPKLPQSSLDDSFPESPPINGVSAAEKAEKQLSRYDAEEWNMMTKKQVTAFVNANDDDRAVVGDLEAGSFSRVFVERRAITRRFAKALLQDSHLKHLEFLKCSGLTDDLLLKLAKQTKLETIALREMNVNDDTLKTIAKITSLEQ